ncbi:hypothetical protein [Kitasatospora sp. CB02891]|uniref:hypothetical protein n=1 Tax=Kitasatospora sp. CB02891 TaxID=2020329 RepID=UPI000C27AB8A|nr:hypothetical protein [Kitasatospora sp. CB02891]PJN23117.1 hypothetical protein CG736_25540 [Kitasatospora sp. CB02891]
MSHPDDAGRGAVAAVTDRAAQRAKEIGADQVLEALRAELELRPRLGRLIRTAVEGGQRIELYSTRIEGDAAAGRPAVNVVHAFAPPRRRGCPQCGSPPSFPRTCRTRTCRRRACAARPGSGGPSPARSSRRASAWSSGC